MSLLWILYPVQGRKSIVTRPEKVGITTVRFFDENRKRPLLTEIWYPIDHSAQAELVSGLWVRCPEARDAPFKHSAKKYPLVVMSHGNGGDRMNTAWIAEILASNDYVVAAIDHHGNTWSNPIAEYFVKIWERPLDVSSLIDRLMQEDRLSPYIDFEKIGFIGYSLGGQTGIWLAGGTISRFDRPDIDTIPKEQMPRIITDSVLESVDFAPVKHSYKDPRIRAFILMAPALASFFEPSSLQAISLPICIFASEGDQIVPLEKSTKLLAQYMKRAIFRIIPGAANHYVYLNEVSKVGKMMLKKTITNDDATVNRSKIHEHIGKQAVVFFDENL